MTEPPAPVRLPLASMTHLHRPAGLFDHELQTSKHRLRRAGGVQVRVAVVRVVQGDHHRLVSGQLWTQNAGDGPEKGPGTESGTESERGTDLILEQHLEQI